MKWHTAGHTVILVTGRPEPLRGLTEKLLTSHGIIYNRLIMDCGPNPRVLINDMSDQTTATMATAINLPRNLGVSTIKDDFSGIKEEAIEQLENHLETVDHSFRFVSREHILRLILEQAKDKLP